MTAGMLATVIAVKQEEEEAKPGTRRAKNGVLQDVATGRFIEGGKPTNALTSETARGLRQRRTELAQRQREIARMGALRGLVEGAASELPAGVAPTLGHATAAISQAWTQAALANAMDKPRESVTAGSAALKLAGLWPERGAAAAGPMVNVQVNVSPELLRHWGVEIVDSEARDIGVEDE